MTASRVQKNLTVPAGTATESVSMNYSESDKGQMHQTMGKDSKHCCSNQSAYDLADGQSRDEVSAEENSSMV